MSLSPEAGRVLGCLVEKQLTTPQQYPLTLNALTAATNQTTNRDPVVSLGDDAVLAALDELRAGQLIRVVLPSHGRSVKRYRHVLDEAYGLDAPRYGLLAALLLRGPQTVGELRARTERMVDLPSISDVEEQLTVLAEHPEGLARLLPRRPGQKEDRWQQIVAAPWSHDGGSIGGDEGTRPQIDGPDEGQTGGGEPDTSISAGPPSVPDRLAEAEALRSELDALRDEVHALRQELDALRQGLGG
ncbi:MAG: DUF480 domain-containing protein [Acidimicrobiales bacterium]